LGQKVHPLGFRLVTTQKPKSIWYSNFATYSQFIEEDLKIRTFIEQTSKKCGISEIIIKRNGEKKGIEIVINTAKPGFFVGQKGEKLIIFYENLKKKLSLDQAIFIKINKVKYPYAIAELVGDLIVELLEKRIPFKKAVKKAIDKTNKTSILGIKIQIAGRLNGAEMARTEWTREGRVPLQTLRADIDYAEKRANTIYGVLGIKIWLFKGEII